MPSTERHEFLQLLGRYAAERRHNPDRDHSALRAEMRAAASLSKIAKFVNSLDPAERQQLRDFMAGTQ